MNRTAWLAGILRIGGVLETGTGLGLLVAPSALASFLLGSPLEGAAVAVARLAGGGVLAVGIACWCARDTPLAPASLGVAWAFLAYNVVACVILAVSGPPLADGGLPALGASILHGLLALALLRALLGRNRSL